MEPIKIGWLGSALDGPGGGYDKIHRLAFDEAAEQGLLDRPVEFVLHAENGLPQGSAKNATDGFRYLVDEGCIGVAGAYSSDNAITVGPLANELQVPLISWCGTERLQGDYCFRLGNGDCGGDAALVVGVAEAQRPRARRGAERDLAERRGVLPVLPPGVPAPRRQHRRGRDREPESRRTSRRTSTTCARSSPTRSSTWATGCSPRRACCARRSTSSAGTRRASWAPRSCST